jgi:hypothetical protein
VPILDATDVDAVWSKQVSRVPGAPTTILGDTVAGTTASLAANAKLDAVLAKLDHANARLDALTGANINTLAVQIATELATRLGGPNGHIMTDGDISRFADACADEVILRLQQGGAA